METEVLCDKQQRFTVIINSEASGLISPEKSEKVKAEILWVKKGQIVVCFFKIIDLMYLITIVFHLVVVRDTVVFIIYS